MVPTASAESVQHGSSAFDQGKNAVGRTSGELLMEAAGPFHLDTVICSGFAQAEVKAQAAAG